jgi:NADPH:quinone reductase-like Zn-dependent oxidoreductase
MGRLVFYGLSEALPGARRNWVRAALARFKTRPIHPLSLVGKNQGVFGIHLLYLKEKESLLAPALEEIFQGIVEGRWKPIMDRAFPLSRDGAIRAHRFLHERKNLGKVVLEARSS